MDSLQIRQEESKDQKEVEELTREAFWNLYQQGCDEHYLVHLLRNHKDFIPELNLVAIKDNKIVGSIIYSKSYIEDLNNNKIQTITFGPLSVLPQFQKQGIGKALIEQSKNIAKQLGYKAILIYGHPSYYVKQGFKSGKDYQITNSNGKYPYALLVYELYKGSLDGIQGKFKESEVFQVNQEQAIEFDKNFPPKEKFVTASQYLFNITSNAYIY